MKRSLYQISIQIEYEGAEIHEGKPETSLVQIEITTARNCKPKNMAELVHKKVVRSNQQKGKKKIERYRIAKVKVLKNL